MIHLLNVSKTRVPHPDYPASDTQRVTAQCVTCQSCGQSETVPQCGGLARPSLARGAARPELLRECPHLGQRHLTTPQPPGVQLQWRCRDQWLPLYVTRQWEVVALSGPLPLKDSFVVRSLGKEHNETAEDFAQRLKERGYENVKLMRVREEKPAND